MIARSRDNGAPPWERASLPIYSCIFSATVCDHLRHSRERRERERERERRERWASFRHTQEGSLDNKCSRDREKARFRGIAKVARPFPYIRSNSQSPLNALDEQCRRRLVLEEEETQTIASVAIELFGNLRRRLQYGQRRILLRADHLLLV